MLEHEILLFNGRGPGSEHVSLEQIVFEETKEDLSKKLVKGVTEPSIIPFRPEQPNGAAVLVIPGGSYRRQVINLEGSEIAKHLNSFGITAFVLKHRMPGDGHERAVDVPLQDAQRAVRYIRSKASEYGIDPSKLGVMGFSAGGHLASAIGTCYDLAVYEPIDGIDQYSAKPDFLALCYPCISLKGWKEQVTSAPDYAAPLLEVLKKYPSDELVTSETPPSFIMVADDDPVTPPEHSINFYLALRQAKVTAELHIYKQGKHGFGLGTTRGAVQEWMTAFQHWFEASVLRG